MAPRLGAGATELWLVLAEFAAALLSYEARGFCEENVQRQKCLLETDAGDILWTLTRPNASGNKYDYVVATSILTQNDRMTLVYYSLTGEQQEKLLPADATPRPNTGGLTRNFMHVAGWTIRKIGDSAGGLLLEVTHIVHTELERLPFVVPKFLVVGQVQRSMHTLVGKVLQCVTAGIFPAEAAGPPGAQGALELPPVSPRTLAVPRFAHNELAPKLRDLPPVKARDRYAMAKALTAMRCLDDIMADVIVEEQGQEALARLSGLLQEAEDWSAQDCGEVALDITTEMRSMAVPGVKLPVFRSRLCFQAPARCKSPAEAAFEAAAVWLHDASAVMHEWDREQTVLLRRCPTAVAYWCAPVPDAMGLVAPVHMVNAQAIETEMEEDDIFIVRIAECCVPDAKAAELLKPKGELHQLKRDRVYCTGVEIKAHLDDDLVMLDVRTVCAFHGDAVPAFVPSFLLRKELAVLQPARLTRWHDIFCSGLFPPRIQTTDSGAPGQPTWIVDVAGAPWVLDDSVRDALLPLIKHL